MMSSLNPDLVRALAGGAVIGLAAAMFVLLNGRIAGISGILGGLLRPVRSELGWRIAFLLGLILSPLAFVLFAPLPDVHVEAGKASLIVGGLLVGLGTRYGSGCTSGHGVCGIARLSPRSLAATAAFMLAGFATVFVLRHLAAAGTV
ncbi:YeeE/YedE family protein [Massilia atriviolacea]|uniref:YeeE/YedE family protein n=1 Tax=Massilia atriviolacea TaxID=2495579 RepID=A0A430HMJ5_9BURK|nr:YeeE/YedE family protein [Massilia atriviolacea]RSZ58699.1 YeeE/YedE family protein [Massilia atriviolacea]